MASKGMVTPAGKPDFAQLEQYYENSLMEIASRVLPTRKVMVYQEVFDNNVTLPSKVVFGVWKRNAGPPSHRLIPEEVSAIAKAGHEVVLMNGNAGEWYLNDGFGNGNVVSGWGDVYLLDPLNGTDGTLTPAESARIIGGEVSLWGEEINGDNIQQKAWPRASAFAERMWSKWRFTKEIRSQTALAEQVGPRLVRMYCKIRQRGIKASPVSPGSCSEVYVPP